MKWHFTEKRGCLERSTLEQLLSRELLWLGMKGWHDWDHEKAGGHKVYPITL